MTFSSPACLSAGLSLAGSLPSPAGYSGAGCALHVSSPRFFKGIRMKQCKVCNENKPLGSFREKRNMCKPCEVEQRKLYPMSREAVVRKNLKARYGITVEEVNAIHAEQNGRCKICDIEIRSVLSYTTDGKRCVVDHNALTGEVRGLLCNSCNLFIGMAGEDMGRLHKAIVYLAERGTYHATNEDCYEEAHQDAEEDRQGHG